MTSSATNRYLSFDDSQMVWDLLCQQTDALVRAWAGGTPPALAQFLPAQLPPAVRRIMMAELVKVDLEHRWQPGRERRRLEDYLLEFPELGPTDRIPSDLIYEEFHIRKQSGDVVDPQEYFVRFPSQSPELIRLLGLESPYITTSCNGREELEHVEPGQRIDDFDLLTRLGRGAFASVFLARQVSMQRLVALKVSANRSSEPQTLAQLDHPHIVRVYDQRLVPERRLRLLYMQYVAGGTLQGVVEQLRRVPPAERSGQVLLDAIDRELGNRGESPPSDSRSRTQLARATWPQAVCWVGARLAAALEYAHQRGVLHRDVKPANVLLASDAAPKLVDFNISFNSKLEGVTPAAYFGGSLAYMAPEQLEACNPVHPRSPDELDGRADQYSLGVVLWELLTGNRPFEDRICDNDRSATLSEMTERRRRGLGADAWDKLPRDRPEGLVEVLRRCLSPDADARFRSTGSMARQLELCLSTEAQRLLAPPRQRWRQFLRSMSGALAVLLAVGILPNVVLSALNIYYNENEIVRGLGTKALGAFWNQLVPVNGVFYGTSIALGIYLHWQVLQALANRKNRAREDLQWLRRRALNMGFYVSLIIYTAWSLSGVVFPLLIGPHISADVPHTPLYVHFIASQVLSGALAGTLAFFLLTFVALRFLYPVFLDPDTTSEHDLAPLARTRRRVWINFGLAALMPLWTLMILVFSGSDMGRLRVYFGLLTVLGLGGTGVGFVLLGALLADLAALASAIRPGGDGLGTSSELSDSYSTGSGR